MASEVDEQLQGGDEMGKEQLDCPVCIQPCVHPVKLPCGHIFCFLCMKGVAMRNRTCALCRHPIPMSFLNNPELVDKTQLTHVPEEVKWFYQGRNHGWWQFEARMEKDLEKRYQEDDKDIFDIQIAGYLYTIDLSCMEQYRKGDRVFSRAIKRDLVKHVSGVKGTAGIQTTTLSNLPRTVEGDSTPPEAPTTTSTSATQRDSRYQQTSPATRHSGRATHTSNTELRLSDSPIHNSSGSSSSPSGIRRRVRTQPAGPQSSNPVDITQLVAEMNLNIDSSDDEPATAV